MRKYILTTLAGVLAFVWTSTASAQEKTTDEKLTELQQQVLKLTQQVEAILQFQNFSQQMQTINDRLSRIEARLNDNTSRPQVTTSEKPKETGTIKLENRTAFMSTITVNGSRYRLAPLETRYLNNQEVGDFRYQVDVDGFGTIQNMRTRNLQSRETFAITVYP